MMKSLLDIFKEALQEKNSKRDLILAVIFLIAAVSVKYLVQTDNSWKYSLVLTALSVINATNFYTKVDNIVARENMERYKNGSPSVDKDGK